MKGLIYKAMLFSLAGGLLGACQSTPSRQFSLKESLKGKFLIGTALNTAQIEGTDTAGIRLVKEHFNAIVPENCMKCEVIHPEENRYDFTLPDQFVKFGEQEGLFMTGHTLIWHSQLAPWFCKDSTGQLVSKEVLTQRMKDHIYTVVGRYKGRIKGWDVVNEAILDDGSYRHSVFYEILGEEFIPLVFRFAHEADPEAELYYNDYSMAHPAKREAVVKLVNQLKTQGIRIDAVGLQGHMNMTFPQVEEFEKTIEAIAATGVKVMVTEFDLTALPTPDPQVGANVAASFEYQKEMNPYVDNLPDSVATAWNARMGEFLELFSKHSDKISRVTAWGVSDGDSWRNDWPMRGRTDYALFFDRDYQPKPAIEKWMN